MVYQLVLTVPGYANPTGCEESQIRVWGKRLIANA